MINKFRADLHIHTCLSPCAELDMSPAAIVQKAIEKDLDIIAITDHNSAENTAAAQKAAVGTKLTVLAGMEVATSEEAHIIALFDDAEQALNLQHIVYDKLLPGLNDEKRFGEQIVVNEKDEVMSFNNRLLIASTELSAQSLVDTVRSLGGIAIASHIDKQAFSIISQLGFIPPELNFDGLEISPLTTRDQANELYEPYSGFTWLTSSDAHYLSDIGRRSTTFYIKEPNIKEMALALKNLNGRKVEWS